MNAITTARPNDALTGPQHFDTAILAGTKSPNTIEQYRMHFAAYCDFAGSFAAATKPATLARWRLHLFENGYTARNGAKMQYSVNAINQRLAAIRGVMAEAAQQGYMAHAVADDFRAVKGLKQTAAKERRNAHARTKISKEDMQRIIDAPDTATPAGMMHRALLLTLATSGIRISEAVTLKESQIEWHTDESGKSGWVIYVAGKNQVDEKPRALGSKAHLAIDSWLKTRAALGIDSEYIFTGFSGRGSRNPSDKPITRQAAWQTVQRYAKALGLAHIKPHDFRRYVGTQLAAQDIRIAQNQLGHKRIETTAQNYVLDSVKVGVTDDLV